MLVWMADAVVVESRPHNRPQPTTTRIGNHANRKDEKRSYRIAADQEQLHRVDICLDAKDPQLQLG